MLGEAFYKQFKNYYDLRCTDIDLNEDWLSYLDFRSLKNYRDDVVKFQPDYLFHLGAFTDLEFCEIHPKDTYETNTRSVENGVKIVVIGDYYSPLRCSDMFDWIKRKNPSVTN